MIKLQKSSWILKSFIKKNICSVNNNKVNYETFLKNNIQEIKLSKNIITASVTWFFS